MIRSTQDIWQIMCSEQGLGYYLHILLENNKNVMNISWTTKFQMLNKSVFVFQLPRISELNSHILSNNCVFQITNYTYIGNGKWP